MLILLHFCLLGKFPFPTDFIIFHSRATDFIFPPISYREQATMADFSLSVYVPLHY